MSVISRNYKYGFICIGGSSLPPNPNQLMVTFLVEHSLIYKSCYCYGHSEGEGAIDYIPSKRRLFTPSISLRPMVVSKIGSISWNYADNPDNNIERYLSDGERRGF